MRLRAFLLNHPFFTVSCRENKRFYRTCPAIGALYRLAPVEARGYKKIMNLPDYSKNRYRTKKLQTGEGS
jgi:hypothetical protein